MAITFYKERPADSLTIALWDYLTDPVYAEGGDTKQAGAPSADPGNATEWGLNNQFREIADKLCELAVFGDIISISTQLDFEKYFGKSYGDDTCQWHNVGLGYAKIPANVIIIMSPISGNVRDSLVSPGDGWGDDGTNSYNGRPAFVLKNKVALSDNVVIKGFNENNVVMIKDDSDNVNEDNIRFCSDYKAQSVVSGVVDNDFTVADSTGFVVGDLVSHIPDYQFYRIISIPDGTSVLVDRDITGAASENLSSMVTGVKMDGWSYDGRGGIEELGGSIDNINKNGGAFDVLCLGESELNCKIINHKITGTVTPPFMAMGAAICGMVHSYKITAEKIYHCGFGNRAANFAVMGCMCSKIKVYYCNQLEVGTYGAGVQGCENSDIKAYYCSSIGTIGGTVFGCPYSNIELINPMGDTAVNGCDYSDIKVFNNKCTYIAVGCQDCFSIWGDSGIISGCTLGGVRLVGNDTAGGDTYTSNPTNTGGYTNAVS